MTQLRYMEACDLIRSDILSGVFPFGSRLKIADLADRYNTSHMPIREALRLLNGEGLVDMEPNKGVRVRKVDRAFIENLFDVRVAIEVMQARRAAERITPEQITELHAARLDFENKAQRGDVGELLACNLHFHGIISAASGNTEATSIEIRHWRILPALWKSFGYPKSRIPVVIDDHRHIENAIATHDVESATALTAAHTLRAKINMLEVLEQTPQNNKDD